MGRAGAGRGVESGGAQGESEGLRAGLWRGLLGWDGRPAPKLFGPRPGLQPRQPHLGDLPLLDLVSISAFACFVACC